MSMLTAAAAAAVALAASGAALAHPALNDAQYLAAARCAGLMASPALGRLDTRQIDAVLKSEGAARSQIVFERADEIRRDALRQASHAGVNGRAELVSERGGVCAGVGHASMMASAGDAGQAPSR